MGLLRVADQTSLLLTDEAIVRRVIAGEKELFEIIVRRYNRMLFRVIRSYLTDRSDAQDAMQNTYLKAFGKLHQFQGSAAFHTWLVRIGINEALLRLRDLKKVRKLYVDSPDINSNTISQVADKQMDPEKTFIKSEAKLLLEHAIDGLPEKYRVIYVLKEIQGLEHNAIAECLNISESNVKVRLHRARTLMKDALYKLSAQSEVFEFGNRDCDAVVDFVMSRI